LNLIRFGNQLYINTEGTFTISLRNSKGDGVAGQRLSVKSELGNILNNDSPDITVVTNTNGQAEVTLLASNAGNEVIIASKPDAPGIQESTYVVTISDEILTVTPVLLSPPNERRCTSIGESEDINNNRILDIGEDINGNNQLDLGCEVPLNKEQTFEVQWHQAGNAVFEEIIISTSRGETLGTEITNMLPPDDPARFSLKSDNAGTAIVTVRGDRKGLPAPSMQFSVKFVATEASSITIQANPAVIGVNPVGTDTEKSDILAVVRDAENNLVFGKLVNFVLDDVTGGKLTEGSAFTDDFGRASTVYIAGPTSSAANGVEVTATVADTTTPVSKLVSFTVAKRDLFVVLGSGNELQKEEGVRYKIFHTVLVTDSNGTPVSDAEITLSIYPLLYRVIKTEDNGPSTVLWECPNEDINRNGLLDIGEDNNGNNKLDPGNVITVEKLRLTTDETGFADFNVVYAIQFANWIEAEITARATVAGSESSSIIPFQAVCSKEDADAGTCPIQNPFPNDNLNGCKQL
jgi:adhesin/invasin